jgi:hypothetical protein
VQLYTESVQAAASQQRLLYKKQADINTNAQSVIENHRPWIPLCASKCAC